MWGPLRRVQAYDSVADLNYWDPYNLAVMQAINLTTNSTDEDLVAIMQVRPPLPLAPPGIQLPDASASMQGLTLPLHP